MENLNGTEIDQSVRCLPKRLQNWAKSPGNPGGLSAKRGGGGGIRTLGTL